MGRATFESVISVLPTPVQWTLSKFPTGFRDQMPDPARTEIARPDLSPGSAWQSARRPAGFFVLRSKAEEDLLSELLPSCRQRNLAGKGAHRKAFRIESCQGRKGRTGHRRSSREPVRETCSRQCLAPCQALFLHQLSSWVSACFRRWHPPAASVWPGQNRGF